MKQRLNRGHINTFIAGILLAIVSVYYASSTMFSHTHVIEGATIIHSHIYGEGHTDSEDGNHTENELTLIQHLSTIIALKGESIFIAEVLSTDEYSNYIPLSFYCDNVELFGQSSPRAPPQMT